MLFTEPKTLVEYVFTNNNIFTQTKGILVFDNSTSTYQSCLKNSINSNPEQKGSTILIGGNPVDVFHVYDWKREELNTYDSLEDEDVIQVTESVPNFNWDISSKEKKQIGNYNCNKATSQFRGRNYTAWYTLEIPCKSGPWKFSGLPGLIVDIADDTQTYQWSLKKIVYPTDLVLNPPRNIRQKISILEYTALAQKRIDLLRARVKAALPRDVKTTIPKNSRRGIEVVYEWEK